MSPCVCVRAAICQPNLQLQKYPTFPHTDLLHIHIPWCITVATHPTMHHHHSNSIQSNVHNFYTGHHQSTTISRTRSIIIFTQWRSSSVRLVALHCTVHEILPPANMRKTRAVYHVRKRNNEVRVSLKHHSTRVCWTSTVPVIRRTPISTMSGHL